MVTGADRLCAVLRELGVEVVFGLPGAQNLALFEALRTSGLRTVVPTHELAASFMANGYARASGRPGVLVTIPGPGFTYALTGLAEARLDSVPLIHILGAPATEPGRRYQLQALDQRAVVAPLVKAVIEVETGNAIELAAREAFRLCRTGEPGPVVVQVSRRALTDDAPAAPLAEPAPPADPVVDDVLERLLAARRPFLYAGQGAFSAEAELRKLVETLRIPLATTTSARGVLPEDHPWVLRSDRRSLEALNAAIGEADLVLALGVKFSHNGAFGFGLQLPADLIHLDASEDVLGANYPATIARAADVPSVIRTFCGRLPVSGRAGRSEWTEADVAGWNARSAAALRSSGDPRIRGARPETMAGFFEALRRALPPESHLVLDSGMHQMMARRHFPVRTSRGLILPTDLQSMGFALPAAIGAKLARPGRPIVALLGDGGFAMSGLELSTAVREVVDLTVVVFNDGRYGLIHRQQLNAYGHTHGTVLENPDIEGIAVAAGASYERMAGDVARALAQSVARSGVTVLEVPLGDPPRKLLQRARKSLRSRLRRWLPHRLRR